MQTVYATFSAVEMDVLQALGFTISTVEDAEFELPTLRLVNTEPDTKIAPYSRAQLIYGDVDIRLFRMCDETFYRLHIGLPNGSNFSATADRDSLLWGLGEEETKAMLQKWNL